MTTDRRLCIMIVEDNEINRSILMTILSDTYHLIEACNGQEALDQLEKNGDRINAILLDIVMPVMDGHAFLQALKGTKYASMPVVVATGSDTGDTERTILREGAYDFVTKPYNADILRLRLQNAINRSDLKRLAEFKHLAEHDTLTGLYNRSHFFAETARMIEENPDQRFFFARFDIERFHVLNTLWGEEKGNEFLQYIARGIRKSVQKMPLATFGRITADIFCICIPDQDYDDARFMKKIRQYVSNYGKNYYIKPCVSIYRIDEACLPIEKIYDRASAAAKKCKTVNSNQIVYFDSQMKEQEYNEQIINRDMEEALRTGQFILYYQPKYDVKRKQFYGAEALVRWDHPERGMISPGRFIPVFEKNGFIARLDHYVWNEAARQIRRFMDEGMTPPPVSVNISRTTLGSNDVVGQLVSIVQENDIPPSLLNLEITESAYMDNPAVIIEIVQELQKNGFEVMMDDFGSGYSSLNILKDIPFDYLKVDLKFVEETAFRKRGTAILSSIIEMAKKLHTPVVMEGVETEEQADFMAAAECDYIQGFYYARPMPVSEWLELIHAGSRES